MATLRANSSARKVLPLSGLPKIELMLACGIISLIIHFIGKAGVSEASKPSNGLQYSDDGFALATFFQICSALRTAPSATHSRIFRS